MTTRAAPQMTARDTANVGSTRRIVRGHVRSALGLEGPSVGTGDAGLIDPVTQCGLLNGESANAGLN